MFGFGSSRKPVLGIDIGASSIKIVELKLNGEIPVLSNYAWASFDNGSLEMKGIESGNLGSVASEYIRKMLQMANMKSKRAYVSIPAFGGLITLIDFPEMPKEDMEQAIKFEAHKYIPTSLDDVVISWDVAGKKAGKKPDGQVGGEEKGMMEVLLVAASKSRVKNYEGVIKNAGLDLKSIDIETFPLIRSLVGNDPGNFIIVDIGAKSCNIVLVEKGTIKINRNIDAGGRDITRVISRNLQIDYDRAESMKMSDKNFFDKNSYVEFPILETITGEISRTVNSYYKNEGFDRVNGLILSGGTAGLTGISEFFQEKLGMRTFIGNPFRRVGYAKKMEAVLKNNNTRFSVAVGLALKGVDEQLREK